MRSQAPSQAQFAAETILQHAPEAFDAALGLRALRRRESNIELFESATELGGLAMASGLFVDGPVVIIAHKDAAAIAAESQENSEAAQQAVQQAEIALGGFREEEFGGEDFARGIVPQAQGNEMWAATFQPSVGRAVSCTSSPSRAERNRLWR